MFVKVRISVNIDMINNDYNKYIYYVQYCTVCCIWYNTGGQECNCVFYMSNQILLGIKLHATLQKSWKEKLHMRKMFKCRMPQINTKYRLQRINIKFLCRQIYFLYKRWVFVIQNFSLNPANLKTTAECKGTRTVFFLKKKLGQTIQRLSHII